MNDTSECIDFADAALDTSHSANSIFLAAASKDDWLDLFKYCVRFKFKSGDEIIRQGDLGQSIFIISEGELATIIPEKNAPDGVCLAVMPATSVFGEQAFFDGQPRSASIRAITDGELLELTRDSFEKLTAENPRLSSMILFDLGRIISLRLRATTRFFIDTI